MAYETDEPEPKGTDPDAKDEKDEKTKSAEEDAAVLSEAIENYERAWDNERDNIDAAYEDLAFVAGEQWPDEIKRERINDKRPMLTINRMPQFVRQITGDIRMNSLAIKVRPAGNGASEEIANVQQGLIRNIEAQSKAKRIYVRAAESAARCGVGAFRILTNYADDDAFDQDIRIGGIKNALNVLFDPDCMEPTGKDAKHVFIIERMTYTKFKSLYPQASYTSWNEAQALSVSTQWFDVREMAVAEYWVKKPVTKTLGLLIDGQVVDMEDYKAETNGGLQPVKTRDVDSHEVCQYILTGAEVLEKHEWAGKNIPVIRVIGEEINVGDRTVRHGAIRFAKDPQRAYNFHITTATETHALAPKAPFIGTVEMFKGNEKQWRQANRRNLPYLAFTPDPKAPTQRPERSQVSTDVTTSTALAASSVEDMYATTGIYPASLGQRSNEQSGKAILARQKESDVGTFVYTDNLAEAIEYAGEQLVELIPKIYDTARIVRVMQDDGSIDMVPVNQPQQGQAAAIGRLLNDLSVGKYDVAVETGPAFSTRRQEAAQGMMEFAAQNPQGSALVMDLIAENLDWPGADQMKERFRRALPPGIDPEVDQQRAAEQGPPQPDPVQEATVRMAEGQAVEAQARGQKAMADAQRSKVQATAEAMRTHMQGALTMQETEGLHLDNAKKALELSIATGQMSAMIRQMVAQELRTAHAVLNGGNTN